MYSYLKFRGVLILKGISPQSEKYGGSHRRNMSTDPGGYSSFTRRPRVGSIAPVFQQFSEYILDAASHGII